MMMAAAERHRLTGVVGLTRNSPMEGLILGESVGGGPSLFFYQYAEGSSHNKFLEIRNPTDSEVDLSGYAFPKSKQRGG